MKKTSRILSLFLISAITVNVFAGIPTFASSNDDFDIENGVLVKYNGTDKDVIIPDGVSEIGKEAFTTEIPHVVIVGNTPAFQGAPITSVNIPSSVKKIDEAAFADCIQLTSIKMSDGLTSIGDNAFEGCIKLSNIAFSNSLTSIGFCSFTGCNSLSVLDFPLSLTTIDKSAFASCSALSSVKGSGVTSLGDSAFSDCTSLATVNFLNSSLTCGESAFSGCTALKDIELGGTTFGNIVFISCGLSNLSAFHTLKVIAPYMFEENNFKNAIVIPNSVTSIADHAFPDTDGGISYVIIPPSVKSIGKNAFPTLADGGWTSFLVVERGLPEPKHPKTIIYGVSGSEAEAYAKREGNPFVAITAEQANAGKIAGGTFTLDTTVYTMAPGNTYQIGAKVAGTSGTTIKYYSSSPSVASVVRLGNGNYQVYGIRSGTTYIMFDIIKGSTNVGHISMRVDVRKNIKKHGDSKPCTLQLN